MQAKSKGGRPPKSPEDRAGGAIHFRVRGNYREALERAAKLANRSLSEECEARLNRSVQREAALAEMFGSPVHQPLLLAIGNVVRLADALSDGPEDADAQVRAAVIHLIEKMAGKKASAVLNEASETGHGWRTAAENVALLEKGKLQPRKSAGEIMGR